MKLLSYFLASAYAQGPYGTEPPTDPPTAPPSYPVTDAPTEPPTLPGCPLGKQYAECNRSHQICGKVEESVDSCISGCVCADGWQTSPHYPDECIEDQYCHADVHGFGAVPGPCMDITKYVTKTNSWECRDCFNIRVNFKLRHLAKRWNRKVYLSFTGKNPAIKVAGPASDVIENGRDFNGNHQYAVLFPEKHEFGNNRVDINAEFREWGGTSRLQYAWACPKDWNMCDPADISQFKKIKGTGKGHWDCRRIKKKGGTMTICTIKCTKGSYPWKKPTQARCGDFDRNEAPKGRWIVGKKKQKAEFCNL